MTDVAELLRSAASDSNSDQTPAVNMKGLNFTQPEVFTPQQKMATIADMSDPKMAAVAAASDSKLVSMGGMPNTQTFKNAAITRITGSGKISSNPIEHDLGTLSLDELQAKYGAEAGMNLSLGRTHAENDYRALLMGQRTGGEGAWDSAKDIGLGAADMVGGIGAIGLGAVDALGHKILGTNTSMGVAAAKGIQALDEAVRSTQSPDFQNQRTANDQRGALDSRDSEQLYENDRANGDGEIVADLKKMGRGALNDAKRTIQNPELLGSAIDSGLGSVLGGGLISKGVSALAGKALPYALRGGAGPYQSAAGHIAASIGEKLPGAESVGIGAMFAGGSYQQTAAKIAGMSDEDLAQNSPYYADLIKQGVTPEDARNQLANNAGIVAGAVAAPLGMAAGAIAKSVIKSPFKADTMGDVGHNIVKSTAEQALQGAGGQFANNEGIKQEVNPNQDLTEGVGEALGSSVVGGLGIGGVLAAPHVVSHTTGAVVGGAKLTFNARLDKLAAANEAKSPSSDANISAAGAAATETMQDQTAHESLADAVIRAHTDSDITPEDRTKDVSLADKITKLGVFSSKEVSPTGLDPKLKTTLDGTTNRVDALLHMANSVNEHGADSTEGLSAARELNKFLGHYEDLINSDQRAFSAIDDNEPAGKMNTQFNVVADHLVNNPTIQKAMAKVHGLSEEEITKLVKPITDESIKDGHAQKDAENIAGLAAIVPEKSNLDAVNSVMKHASDGKVHLTADQHQALLAAWSLLSASKDSLDRQKKMGNKTLLNSVSNDVLAAPGKKGDSALSAAAFTKRIFQNMRAGNVDVARKELRNFGMFADHMANKSDAVNEHYVKGGGKAEPFHARNPVSNTWYEGFAPQVHPKNENSVELAQRINLEAKRTNDIYNNLTKAFPELGGKEKSVDDLHSNLQGSPHDVAEAHSKNERVQPKTDKSVVPVEADAEGAPASIVPVGSSEAGPAQKDEAPALLKAPTVGKNYIADHEGAPFGSKEEAHQAIMDTGHDPAKYNIEPTTIGDGFIAHLKDQGEATTGTKDVPPAAQASDEGAKLPTESELAKAHKFEEGLSKLTPDEVWDKYSAYHDKHNNQERTPYEQLIWDALEREYLRRNPEEAKVSDATNTKPIERADRDLKTEVEPIKEETTSKPTTTEDLYPDLVGTKQEDGSPLKNWFHEAFEVPKDHEETGSRLLGLEKPYEAVREALSSDERLREFMGESKRLVALPANIARTFKAYLGLVPAMRQIMEARLAAKLEKENKTGENAGKSLKDMLNEGVEANRFAGLRQLNLLEKQEDGSYRYNPQLAEQALMAGLHWLLVSDRFASKMDAPLASSLTGVSPDKAGSFVERLGVGLSPLEAKRSLADRIVKFWGLKENKNATNGHTDGIAEAMAVEVLKALQGLSLDKNQPKDEQGLLRVKKLYVMSDDTLQEEGYEKKPGVTVVKDVSRLISNLNSDDLLHAAPSLIEEAVLREPADKNYYAGDTIKVSDTQMNSPSVKNTRADKTQIEKANAEPHYLSTHMHDLYTAFGNSGLLDLFGGGSDLQDRIDKGTINKEHASSLDGKNTTVRSAWDALKNRVSEMKTRPLGLEDAILYDNNISAIGRLQQLGGQTPQGSKLLRAAILPTWSTLNLSDAGDGNKDHIKMWTMGIAQALGVKIHTLDPFDAEGTSGNTLSERVNNLIENRFSKSIEMLQDHLQDSNQFSAHDLVDQLKSDFAGAKEDGASLTENAVQALLEHARWLEADDKEKANFKTPLYVEADGVTNGLANAIHLTTTGRFTAAEFDRLAKVGHFFNGTKTMNEHRALDGVDLYELASQRQQKHLDDLYDQYEKKNPDVSNQMDNVNTVLGRLVKGIKFDLATGDVEVDRDVTKNPATITVYGAGPSGIAAKLADNLVRKLYEKFSAAAETLHENPEADIHEALMGKGSTADDLEEFQAAFNKLVTGQTLKNFGKLSLTETGLSPIEFSKFAKKDFVNFALGKKEFEAIQQNILHLFVDPMVNGINDTVGKSLLESKKTLQKASQAQSVVLEYLFNQRVAELQAERAKSDNYKVSDGISLNDVDAIQRELLKQFPMVDAPGQRFFPVGRDTSDLANTTSSGLNGEFKTNVQIPGPSDGGVKVLAMLNVGMGDGKMMQTAINKYDVGGTHVFDGNNFALDKIADGSRKMNQAANDAWQGNSIRAVLKSFETANSHITADMFKENPELRKAVTEVLFGKNADDVSPDVLKEAFNTLEGKLNQYADSVDDRHQVMREFESHIDNMAGAQESFKSPGISLAGMSHEDIADRMNTRLDEVQKENATNKQAKKEKAIAFERAKNLEAVMDSVDFTPEQNLIMREVDRSGALKDYQIKTGPDAGSSPNTKGFIDLANKVIHLISPTAETITHEAIHAATFNTVLAHYEGADLGLRSKEIKGAVGNLEKLMEQFRTLDIDETSKKAPDFIDALAAINEYLNADDSPLNKARALNEFMAWSLANKSLSDTLKETKVSPLVQMAKNVWEQVKNIVFGSKLDVSKAYAHVLFNTAIIAREQPTVADLNRKVMLFQNSTYGTDARLSGFNKTFSDMFSRFLKEDDTIKTRAIALVKSNTDAADLMAMANAQGFYMDQQARGVFTKVVSALASKMTLDPNSLVAISELYQHVSENLTSDMLMDPNIVDQQQAGELAKRKYDMLMGNAGSRKDAQGHSSMMPVFLGLSLVDDGLRDALRQMGLPKGEKHLGGTTNDWLRNTANDQLQGMSEIFAGQGKAKNVQDAIDNLTKQIGKTALDANSAMEQLALAPNAGINRANEIFVDFVGRVVDVVRDQNQKIQSDPTKSNFVKKAADIAEFVANFATQEGGERIAEGVTTFMNKLTNKNWRDVQEIVSEITGRSQSNGGPYDYIKLASTMIGQVRQQYRDHFPELFNEQFKRKLEKNEQSNMHLSMGRTDLAALLSSGSHSSKDVLNMLHDERASNREIRVLETSLKAQDPQHFDKVQAKAQQLADHMVNRTQGKNLLLNAQAVSDLLQESPRVNRVKPDKAYVDNVDRLTTLYALNKLPPEVRKSMRSLVQSEPDGMNFVLSYLKGNRSDETKKATGMALYNSRKGYIPSVQQEGVSLRVAKDSEAGPLLAQSYVRIGDYKGSKAEENYSTMGYYYAPVSNRAGFSQGIIQNAAHTSGGVEVATGKSMGLTGGRITNPAAVERISKQLSREGSQTTENLQPIFNDKGKLVAYERSIDPTQLSALNQDTHMGRMIGVWQGRQVEEGLTQEFNKSFVDVLHDNYKNASKDEKQGYVDLNDPKSWGNDKVILDALHLMTPETREYIKDKFGEQFMVRRDLVNDAIGYRKATIGDAWTGNCRWSDETQAGVRNLCMSVFGNKAYAQMVNSENDWKYLVREAKTNIVVKSIIVPLANFASNLLQLASRGVPMAHMATSIPKKIAEAEAYQKGRLALMKAEGQLRAAVGAQDFTAQLKLKNKIEAINDRFTRLSIWPLIKAGEFGSISHSDMSKDDQMLTGGRLHDYVDKQISKLPKAVQNAGDLALIGKDTALFQGLAKSVEYGDFLGKAIQYDHYVNKKGFTEKQALARITEEYVNFDRLPGRSRGYLDEMGMMWFFNFKLRTTKVALSMLRENPLQALIGTMMPAHQLGLGTPFADNIVSKTFAGHLGYSLGPGMMLHSPMLNPLAHVLGKL